jgi:hypothetical protein
MIAIREDYDTYQPPKWVRRTVERLLHSVAESHTIGLSAIVLTDKQERARGRRSRRNRNGITLGCYHRQWKGEPAWIELMVDKIVEDVPRPFRMCQFVNDMALGRVLHEIGRHLDDTARSIARPGEPGAIAWQTRLLRIHFRQRYWYVRPFVPVLRAVTRMVVSILRAVRPRP